MQTGNANDYSPGTSGRIRECHTQNQKIHLGEIPRESTITGNEPDTTANKDCSRRDRESNRDYQVEQGGKINIGGMLSQLRALQKSHLAYVKAHEERLKLRLEDNLKHQKEVIEAMNALEAKILEILGSQE